jgi:hypothetical protein
MRLSRIFLGLSLCGALAGTCQAEPRIRLGPPTAAPLRLDLADAPYDAAQALKAAGVARTALDQSLPGGAGTVSAGVLCGIQPGAQASGGAGAYGVDREGRFVGAQLRLRFR